MDGEFLCEEFAYQMQGIGGGNFLILADNTENALKAAEEAVKSMKKIKNTILPFPGGVVRSGSKVGSKYKNLIASTNFEYCPSIKSIVNSKLKKDIGAVLEIVIDGLTENDIADSIRIGISSILKMGSDNGIKVISAGNYGGKLGPYHFHLRKIIE